MKTDIQETELYKSFKKALGIKNDMRIDDNPFVVECCQIAERYATEQVNKLNERNSVYEGEIKTFECGKCGEAIRQPLCYDCYKKEPPF